MLKWKLWTTCLREISLFMWWTFRSISLSTFQVLPRGEWIEYSNYLFNRIFNLPHRTIYLSEQDFLSSLHKAENPDFDGAFLISEDHLAYMNMLTYPNVMVNYAKEVLATFNLCVYFNKKSSLIREVNNNLIDFNTYGFVKLWKSKFIQKRYLFKQINKEPKDLQISQLLGGFEMLCMGLAISFLAFVIELLTLKLKILKKLLNFFH